MNSSMPEPPVPLRAGPLDPPSDQNLTGVPGEGVADSVAPTLIRHGRCGKGWAGASTGHCGTCHETFSRGAFDPHQSIKNGVITCSTGKLIGHEMPWGTLWRLPGGGRDWAAFRAKIVDGEDAG